MPEQYLVQGRIASSRIP